MTESEPSAPLPVGASIRFSLAAALERAERAERERDDAFERADGWHFGHEVWKGRALAAEAELDQARAQLAKVREALSTIRSFHGNSIDPEECMECADGNMPCRTSQVADAALDPAGATEDEAGDRT